MATSKGTPDELGIDGLTDVEPFASGGSSTVYRARQESLDRSVAVKVIHRSWSSDTQERLERERRVTGRLSGHAEVVPVFQTGITIRGEPYLLLPYYARGSLSRLLTDHGSLPWTEATYLMQRVSEALAHCHDFGVVHRDVKPGNVLLTDRLRPRLADFGITMDDGEVTDSASVAYTPFFSPPEARQPGVVHPTIDVYGLGATLGTLLAGLGPAPDREPVVGLDAIPAPVLDLVHQSMDHDPAARPSDARAFALQLQRIRDSSDPGSTERMRTTRSRATVREKRPTTEHQQKAESRPRTANRQITANRQTTEPAKEAQPSRKVFPHISTLASGWWIGIGILLAAGGAWQIWFG